MNKYSEAALKHYKTISKERSKEINSSIAQSKIYSPNSKFIKQEEDDKAMMLTSADSVSCLFGIPDDGSNVCILNYASYKYPGGMFLEGSMAQEECLCHASDLFPILVAFNDTYYDWNRGRLNRALYLNRAIYTPNVIFQDLKRTKLASVLTCAAPNYRAAKRYNNVTKEENREVMRSRVEFMYNICAENNVDTLIAGAWGCGVFGQDPKTVCELLTEAPNRVKRLYLAIPGETSRNYLAFENYLRER